MPGKVDLKKLRSLDEDDEEYDDLLVDRRVEMALAIPRPTCCQAAQDYPVVTFHVKAYEGDSGTNEGSWEAHMHSGLLREFAHRVEFFKNMPPAKFCPFCGTPVPKMQRVDKPDVCRVTDGGYYCDTCKERLSNCLCDPPEAGFEPVKDA